MSDAVDNAAMMLYCVGQKYKESGARTTSTAAATVIYIPWTLLYSIAARILPSERRDCSFLLTPRGLSTRLLSFTLNSAKLCMTSGQSSR